MGGGGAVVQEVIRVGPHIACDQVILLLIFPSRPHILKVHMHEISGLQQFFQKNGPIWATD
jgi:hypothetical protein